MAKKQTQPKEEPKPQPKKMTDFEEDSMWMAWRYCIGRHTIASHFRAGETAKFIAQFLPDMDRNEKDRVLFWSKDIIREVTDRLRWTKELCGEVDDTYESFDKVIERVNNGEFREDKFGLLMTIDDLLVWYSLSKWMNPNTHKKGLWHYKGRDETYEYFESWVRIGGKVEPNEPLYRRIKVEPERFQECSGVYLCDEYFVRDIDESEEK